MSKTKEKKRPGKAWRIFKICILSLLVLTISAIIFMVSYLMGIEEWQQFEPSQIKDNMQISLRLYDKNGEEYLTLAGEQDRQLYQHRSDPSSCAQCIYRHRGCAVL